MDQLQDKEKSIFHFLGTTKEGQIHLQINELFLAVSIFETSLLLKIIILCLSDRLPQSILVVHKAKIHNIAITTNSSISVNQYKVLFFIKNL